MLGSGNSGRGIDLLFRGFAAWRVEAEGKPQCVANVPQVQAAGDVDWQGFH